MHRRHHGIRSLRWFLPFAAVFVAVLGLSYQPTAQADPNALTPVPTVGTESVARARLAASNGGKARISIHQATGKVRFIGATPDQPIRLSAGARSAVAAAGPSSPERLARAFVAEYADVLGVSDASRDLTVLRQQMSSDGRPIVRYQQTHRGLPVFGGQLNVTLTSGGDLIAASGEVLPDPKVDVTPRLAAAEAREIAIQSVAKGAASGQSGQPRAVDLTAADPALWVFSPSLVGAPGPAGTVLVWRVNVRSRDDLTTDEILLVDADSGAVRLRFSQINDGRYRRIYDNENNPAYVLPGPNSVRFEGSAPSAVADANQAYDYLGQTYDYYMATFGRDSINNAGKSLIATVRHCPSGSPCPWQNAQWNSSSQQFAFGSGYTAGLDVVAHEYTHAVTASESGLYYYRQSGALSESISDVFGEITEQQLQGADASWLIGENLSSGAIRSMSNPPAYSQPDRMTSPLYGCSASDNGDVHANSGVGNKAAYLMAEGGSFNGQTISGIGRDQTARVWYEAQTNLLTSGSDYQDLADSLEQGCLDLVGQNGITASTCQQVQKAVLATEMRQQPTGCAAPEAPVCPAGQTATDLYREGFEGDTSFGFDNWVPNDISGLGRWTRYTGYAPVGSSVAGSVPPASAVDHYLSLNQTISLPAGTNAYLRFQHMYDLESGPGGNYDGGVLEYSVNGGTSWLDAGSLFTDNGYNGAIATGFGNPLAGRSGFVNLSNGYRSSRASLTGLAGQGIRLRFRVGSDIIGASTGWLVDDVRVYTCAASAVLPSPCPSCKKTYLPIVTRP